MVGALFPLGMHLEEGIGRGGYRMLALVFLGIGALGLLSSLYAFIHPTLAFFNALGFVLMGVALGALFVLVLVILGRPAPEPEPEALPAGAPPVGIRPVQMEFRQQEEPQPEPEPAPPEPVAIRSPGGPRMPAPAYERAARVVGLTESPTPFDRLPPPDQWTPPEPPRAPLVAPPLKRPRSGMTLGEKRELERMGRLPPKPMLTVQGSPATEEEMELAIPLALHPARTPPPKPGVPTVLAKPAAPDKQDPDWMPEGMTRGMCSKCKTVLLAPQQRPINLRCPRCDKITLLK
jgi:hypothetical protein